MICIAATLEGKPEEVGKMVYPGSQYQTSSQLSLALTRSTIVRLVNNFFLQNDPRHRFGLWPEINVDRALVDVRAPDKLIMSNRLESVPHRSPKPESRNINRVYKHGDTYFQVVLSHLCFGSLNINLQPVRSYHSEA